MTTTTSCYGIGSQRSHRCCRLEVRFRLSTEGKSGHAQVLTRPPTKKWEDPGPHVSCLLESKSGILISSSVFAGLILVINRHKLQTDRHTDRQTDRQTDGRTDGRTTLRNYFVHSCYWHCPRAGSKQLSGVRPSVRTSVPSGRSTPLLRVYCCGPGSQEMSTDCCTAGGQQHPRRSTACSGKCGECHVVVAS